MAESLVHPCIGQWHLVQMVGRGGVAEVYRMEHVQDRSQQRAVKVMLPERMDDKKQIRRFEEEFELLSELENKSIPCANSFVDVAGRPAIVMVIMLGQRFIKLFNTANALIVWAV